MVLMVFFEFENFALHVDGDFAGQVAAGHGGGDFGDVADLGGEVAGHGIDGVGEVLPRAGHAGHDGLAAELAVGADFARHAGDFGSEGAQLIHHGVDGFFELQNFAADVHGNLAGKVAAGHGGGDFGDVADLAGQVAGHGVDGVGQVLPGAGDAGHLGLAAELAVRADFARDARDFSSEDAELLNHGVDDFGRAQEFAFEGAAVHVQPNGLSQISLGDGGDGARDFGGGAEQVLHEGIDGNFHLAPGAAGLVKASAFAGFAFFADDLPDALQFLRHLLVGGDNLVECVGDFSRQAGPIPGKANRKVAVANTQQGLKDYGEFGRVCVDVAIAVFPASTFFLLGNGRAGRYFSVHAVPLVALRLVALRPAGKRPPR